MTRCHDCAAPIIASDDDAHVCIECGGRNRRLKCRCGIRVRLVGDGCPACNPDYWERFSGDEDSQETPDPAA